MTGTNRRSSLIAPGATGGASELSWPELAQDRIKPGRDDALIVVDVQNCFVPGGSLAVTNGDQVIPLVNDLARRFENVILTQDWHTPGHVSFASSHTGKKPFDTVKLPYGTQVRGRITACKAPRARRS